MIPEKGKYYKCIKMPFANDTTTFTIDNIYLSKKEGFITSNKGEYDTNDCSEIFGDCFVEVTPDVVDAHRSLNMVHEGLVNHPLHYNQHPSGIECIEITRHYCFSIGNAIKYLWRAGLKQEVGKSDVTKEIEDLEKAKWYIDDRIKQLKAEQNN